MKIRNRVEAVNREFAKLITEYGPTSVFQSLKNVANHDEMDIQDMEGLLRVAQELDALRKTNDRLRRHLETATTPSNS